MYELPGELVLKVDKNGESENKNEWRVWNQIKNTDKAAWFAPCVDLTKDGLIMVRTYPLDRRGYPDEVPGFFGDIKYRNFGILNGIFVCHDYQYILGGSGMKKAKWR